MTPDAITLLFKEVRNTFPPIKGKPTDDDLLAIWETILPILMEIPFDLLGGVHSLVRLLTEPTRYAANHGGANFAIPSRLPLYDSSIADDATTVVHVCSEAAHKARLNNFASFEAAERGSAKFLRETVKEVWYNDLKDANTFYTKVSALEIMTFLDANSGGLHAVDMISLRTNMHSYYVQADGIPQYINMLEDAQKKAKRAGMPIANVELVMMTLAAVLAAQHFPCKVDDWEGLPSTSRTWTAWKKAFCLAHLKRQQQILASGGGTSRRGTWSSPGSDSNVWLSRTRTQQPCACGNERFSCAPATHGCQLGSYSHYHVADSNQQKTGRCSYPSWWYSGGCSGWRWRTGNKKTGFWSLLLDSRSPHEQTSHERDLRQQSSGPP
jgi:hypothetical protein